MSNGILHRQYALPRSAQDYPQSVAIEMRESILRGLHEGVASGNLGQDNNLHQLKERCYWPGNFNDMKEWCQTCATCTAKKSPTHSALYTSWLLAIIFHD